MDIEWNKLQNGSDIRGFAVGENAVLNAESAAVLGAVFTVWLSDRLNVEVKDLRISAGMDSRITGSDLKRGFIRGIISAGASALDCGMSSTPAMFMSTVIEEFSCHGAVMITASHLPFDRNGFKFFTSDGGLEKADITSLLSMASESTAPDGDDHSHAEKVMLIDRYSELFVKKIRDGIKRKDNFEKPLSGLKIVVDAGNGAGGFFAHQVLVPLGADITGSLFLDPDGTFPNHEPNPENSQAMESIRSAVLGEKADLGIIFDTDVDRAAVVASNGEIVNRNSLIALMSSIVLEEHPGTSIVTDSVTSDGLTEYIEETLGGHHHRFKRGYRNVINEAIRLNSVGQECHLAIETSGHGAMKENYFLDDGAYLVAEILIKTARMKFEENRNLTDIISELSQPEEAEEFRISLLDDDFKRQGSEIIDGLTNFVKDVDGWSVAPVNHEGVRVSCSRESGNGWFLMRLSLHDPVLPLNIESEQPGGVKDIAGIICGYLESAGAINYEKLKNYISS